MSYPDLESLYYYENFSESANGIWRANFGSILRVKAVLALLRQDAWKMTFGNSEDPTLNPTIFTSTTEWAKDILIESSGQYLSFIEPTGIKMYYVAVFRYPYSLDCSAVSVANQIYYLLESTILTIPACIVSTSTTQLTLTSTPISVFATATKNADNSF